MPPFPDDTDFPLLGETRAVLPSVIADMANPSWEAATLRILIVRLSRYVDITKSLSHLFLFSEARRASPGAFVDFAFLPERADRDRLLERGIPWFFGRASRKSPADFDLILVSNAFALELMNLPWLFSTAGLPLKASERESRRCRPFVILGGSNAAAAGSLVFDEGGEREDSFVDALFFGEGEGAIAPMIDAVARHAPGRERRSALARIGGLWLPGGSPDGTGDRKDRIERRILRPMPAALTEYPVLNSEESGTARLAISAGCPGLCSFCLEGWDRLPYREMPLAEILESARRLRRTSGAETLEVCSFNFNTHTSLFELFFELGRIFRRVNFMSQRIDILARTTGLVAAEFAADKHSFTLGIEGISRRMRRFFRKGLGSGDIEKALDRLVAPGLRELKLFFMIAGSEDSSDIAEFGSFVSSLAALKSARSAGARILVSAGFLVRLPFTPLQYAALELDQARLEGIAGELSASCEAAGLEFRLASRFDEYAADQVLSLLGSPASEWLESMPEQGFTYDSSLSRGAWRSLHSWAADHGHLGAGFLGEKSADFLPPLGFIEAPQRFALLRRHYEEARENVDRSLCLGMGCSSCGACSDPEELESIAGHRNAALGEVSIVTRTARLVAAKNAFLPVRVALRLPESLAGSTPAYKGSWLMRRLAELGPEAWKVAFQARESLFCAGKFAELLPADSGFWGNTIFELFGPDRAAIIRLLSALRLRHEGPEGIAGFLVSPCDAPPREPETRLDLRIVFRASRADTVLQAFRRWLSDLHVESTEEMSAEQSGPIRVFRPGTRGMKKGQVLEARILSGKSDLVVDLACGPKAHTGEWFDLIGRYAAASSSIEIRGWS